MISNLRIIQVLADTLQMYSFNLPSLFMISYFGISRVFLQFEYILFYIDTPWQTIIWFPAIKIVNKPAYPRFC